MRARPHALNSAEKKGLLRFSSPTVVRGPCPGPRTVSSGKVRISFPVVFPSVGEGDDAAAHRAGEEGVADDREGAGEAVDDVGGAAGGVAAGGAGRDAEGADREGLALGEGRRAGPGFGAVRPRLRSGEGGLQRVEGGEMVVVGVGEEDRLDRDAEGGGLRDEGYGRSRCRRRPPPSSRDPRRGRRSPACRGRGG